MSTTHAKKKSKAKLFNELTSGKKKDQKLRNAYLLATLSKLAYQATGKKNAYRDIKGNKVTTSLNGKFKFGGEINPKRFKEFGLKLCNPEMPYWTVEKNKKGKTGIQIHNAQAYLVHNKSTVILVFRGTKEKYDWGTNSKYKAKKLKEYGKNVAVHGGFLEAVKLAHKQLNLDSEIRKCRKKGGKKGKKKRKLFVTGHSLGGAMATLWTFINRKNDKVQVSRLYTYGEPSVGNKAFVKAFQKLEGDKFKAYSWINENDPVSFATRIFGFAPTGTRQWITCPAKKPSSPTKKCKKAKIQLKTKVPAWVVPVKDISQHDMTTYMSRILKLAPKKVQTQLKKLGAGKKLNAMIKKAYK